MFQFERIPNLIRKGARAVECDQCMYVARTRKPPQVLYGNSDFSSLEAHCNHEGVEQRDEHGRTYIAPHPSYVGKKVKDGAYLTSSLAAYPAELNCRLATLINSSVISRGSSSS